MKNPISAKQEAFLCGEHKRINLLTGAVRSGKTYISLLGWAVFVGAMPSNYEFIMVGKALQTLKRNCLNLLQELVGEVNFTYNTSQKTAKLFGRTVWLEGANDERSESKIRGMTLGGAYCDELTLFPKGFYLMLLSRLSLLGARLYGTTNPDAPSHWVKTDIIDNEKIQDQLSHWSFTIEDNDYNDPQYILDLKASYSGVLYDRYIRGLWVRAEGAIYSSFAAAPEKYLTQNPEYDFIQVGVDFGGSKSAFAFVAVGLKRDYTTLTALCSERHPAKDVTPERMYSLFGRFVERVQGKYGKIGDVFCDSAEQTLINGLRSHSDLPIRNSLKKPILDRVRATVALIGGGRCWHTEDCNTLRDALCNAVYDEDKLHDERLDDGTSDIDTLDAFEYAWERHITHYMRYGALKAG